MGRQTFTVRAYGFTEAEALREAKKEALQLNGHKDGYSGDINSAETLTSNCIRPPRQPQRAVVKKSSRKTRQKWEYRYRVYEADFPGDPPKATVKTQKEALTCARELALSYGGHYVVRYEKILVQGSTFVAEVSPGEALRGIWEFRGVARC